MLCSAQKTSFMCATHRHKFFQNMVRIACLLRMSGVNCCFLLLLVLSQVGEAQTTCSSQNAGNGVFICYPNPSQNAADATVPEIFHLSAQGKVPDGQVIPGYRVFIDKRLVYEKRFSVPVQKLLIETNVRSPFDSGSHTLQLVVPGAGSAEVKDLRFQSLSNGSFCDPFTRTDPRTCSMSPIKSPLQWSLKETAPRTSAAEVFDGYSAYLKLYSQNLKSIEADVSDAMAVDAQGNLYVASHAFADVDLRKYSPNGSLLYASLIRSCGDGFLSVAGLAVDNAGRAWIAGNTSACLKTTPNAAQSHGSDTGRPTGFVMLVDTKKPGATAQLYVSYLSDIETRISAIRADNEGNAYITGTVASREFHHDSMLSVTEGPARSAVAPLGFVAAVEGSGSGFLWATLVENAELNHLALDTAGDVYITGRVLCGSPRGSGVACDDVVVARLSDRGRRFSYLAHFPGNNAARAIAVAGKGAWIFATNATAAFALQPCKAGVLYEHRMREGESNPPEMAGAPALDAFAATLSGTFSSGEPGAAPKKLQASVQIAPECGSQPQ